MDAEDRKRIQAIRPCRQLDLFSHFLGDATELSNTLEVWDSIPKFSVSARRQAMMRTPDGTLPLMSVTFDYVYRTRKGMREERTCRMEMQPAKIRRPDGSTIDVYPSVDEELVEEVIRKLFVAQRGAAHDPARLETWVYFSIKEIQRELSKRGRTRSIREIKQAIRVLRMSVLELYDSPDSTTPIYSNPILLDVTRLSAGESPDNRLAWMARLPALVSQGINDIDYRQINYGTLMSLQVPMARWLHKRLTRRYTNASLIDHYTILFSTIQRESALLEFQRLNRNVTIVEDALNELLDKRVLLGWEEVERRCKGRKVLDIKYELRAHPEFIKDVKAANLRHRQCLDGVKEAVLAERTETRLGRLQ